jgi:hypothetical protein
MKTTPTPEAQNGSPVRSTDWLDGLRNELVPLAPGFLMMGMLLVALIVLKYIR